MSHKCEHGRDSDVCVECWEEKNLEPRMTMTNEPSELDKAIERLLKRCTLEQSHLINRGTRVDTEMVCNAAKLLNNGPELLLQRWNILLPEIERTFTHKANLNTVKLERDELAKRVQGLEKELKISIQSNQLRDDAAFNKDGL